MTYFNGKRVLITGGTGFIGSHLVDRLVKNGSEVVVTSRRDSLPFYFEHRDINVLKGDLSDPSFCRTLVKDMDLVFHLAGLVKGIWYNFKHPATMLQTNAKINTNIIDAAVNSNVEKFQFVSSACGYPLYAQVPLREEEFFNGEPEPTNGPYGWSKRLGEVQAKAYHDELGFRTTIVRPFNAYGPRDNFDPDNSHVIPGLIRKAVAGTDPFIIWGDGTPTRAFVYVSDIVEGMMLVMEKVTDPDPINLGTDKEVSISELAETIVRLSGVKSQLVYDKSRPNGQPRRAANIQKAKSIGYEPKVSLEEGLRNTIDWYKKNIAYINA